VKQDELREKITGNPRDSDELESVNDDELTEVEWKQRELKRQVLGGE
jgi:hypothetical protein